MFPLYDQPAVRIKPWATALLIAVNLWVFGIELVVADIEAFISHWGFVPARFVWWQGQSWINLWTSMFLHQGWGHLFFNLWFLHLFGDNVEEDLGHIRFLLFYFLCGTAAALLQYSFMPRAMVPMIGASGAIAGVLGYYWHRFPHHRVTTLILWGWWWDIVQLPAALVLWLWFFSQMFNGVFSVVVDSLAVSGVAWWAHIGGFVAGWWLAKIRQRPAARLWF